jgi:hypothetical protein
MNVRVIGDEIADERRAVVHVELGVRRAELEADVRVPLDRDGVALDEEVHLAGRDRALRDRTHDGRVGEHHVPPDLDRRRDARQEGAVPGDVQVTAEDVRVAREDERAAVFHADAAVGPGSERRRASLRHGHVGPFARDGKRWQRAAVLRMGG